MYLNLKIFFTYYYSRNFIGEKFFEINFTFYSNIRFIFLHQIIFHFKVYLRIIPYNEINERIKEEMRTYGNRDF